MYTLNYQCKLTQIQINTLITLFHTKKRITISSISSLGISVNIVKSSHLYNDIFNIGHVIGSLTAKPI